MGFIRFNIVIRLNAVIPAILIHKVDYKV
jgi:hypothetical protein